MKKWKVLAGAGILVVCSAALGMTAIGKSPTRAKPIARQTLVFHVVAFKFNEKATPEQIDKVCADFKELQKKVPQILNYKAGVNNSPEKLDKGFTHCFILAFKNTKARDAYLVHPTHKEFGKSLGGLIADVFVIDFESQ